MNMMRMKTPICVALVFLAACSWGCSTVRSLPGRTMRAMFGRSSKELVAMAFDPADADRRREGVVGLSEKRWGRSEQYLHAYAVISKKDPEPSVRCAAVEALGKANDPQYLPDIVAALSDESASVRLQAATVLDRTPGDIAVEPLQKHAISDSSVDVRMWSAKALRHYRQKPVLATLVRCLADESFGVCYKAHEALVELTGRDLGYEAEDWTAAAAGEDLLAPAPPDPRRPWWDWFGVTRKNASVADSKQPPAEDAGSGSD